MKIASIHQENGKLKKWFKNAIVGISCIAIVGVGITGICISGMHPWSEIVFSNMSAFDIKNNEITVYADETPQINLAWFTLKIQIENHNNAKNLTLIDQSYFDPYKVDPEDIAPQPIGNAEWGVYTEPEFSKMERYFFIDPENDTLNCHEIPNNYSPATFVLHTFVELFFYENASYNFGNLLLVSDPIKVNLLPSSNTH